MEEAGAGDDTRALFRAYLRTRISLGDPAAVFRRLTRRQALAAAGRAPVRVPRVPDGEEPRAGPGGEAPRSGSGGAPATRAERPGEASELRRLSRSGSAEELGALLDLETLRAVAEGCLRCGLHAGRTRVVFGEGDPAARVVCVGEAPGAVEDETGRPFVGPAGRLLDRLLLAVGFRREEVYICNVLKCRPPGNRNPRPEEVETCSPYLLRQLALIDPEVIVAFGTFAARTLLGTRESLGRLRRRTHVAHGYPVVVTYHPAALLRNPWWTRPAWEDLQGVRRVLDGARETPAAPERPGQGGLFG